MLTNSMLWLFSILLALLVHGLGLLLFEPSQPDLPSPNAFSEEIVVMLGEGAGSTSESVLPLRQPDTVTRPQAPDDADVEGPGAAAPQSEVAAGSVEDVIPAPRESDRAAPEEALRPPARDATTSQNLTPLSGIETPEESDTVPDLSAREPEAADTVMLESTVVAREALAPDPQGPVERSEDAQQVFVPQVASTVAVATPPDEREPSAESVAPSAEVSASRPVAPEIAKPDDEPKAVVAPAQLLDDARLVDQPDTVKVEEGQTAVIEDAASPPPDAVVDPTIVPAITSAETEPVPQQEESSSSVVEAAVVEEQDAADDPAAVVLEFETVEAASVEPVQDPDPNAASLVSIEEQIARALTLDETQSTGLGMGVVAKYAGLLKGRLEESMHYPRAARLAGEQGNVVVRFVIDRNGIVLSIVLEKPSGHAILDREAVEMIERAEPFPTMPGEMAGEVLELRVPIAYKIDESTRARDIPPIYLD